MAQEDYRHTLYEGPCKFTDHYHIVQRWRPLFSFTTTMTRKIVVQIRIPMLPLELCNDQFLKRVGSTLGAILKIDN